MFKTHEGSHWPRRTLVLKLAAVTAALATLAACGSGDNGDPAAANDAPTEPNQYSAAAEKAMDISNVQWPEPTEPVHLESGKRVAIVSCGESVTGCHTLSSSTADAAKAAGWQSTVFDANFDTNAAGGYVQQAVSQEFDAVVVIAISPGLMKPAIASAKAANIPIGCLICVYPDTEEFSGVVNVTTSGVEGGLEALGVMAADSKANAVYFYSPAADYDTQKMEAFKEEFANCADCNLTVKELPYDDLTKPGPPYFTGFLSTPLAKEVTWVTGSSDAYTVPPFKTAQNQGLTQYSFAGTDAIPDSTIPMSEPNSLFKVSVTTPLQFEGWAVMDLVMRKAQDMEIWDATKMPVGLVTSENAEFYAKGGIFAPKEGLEAFWTKHWKAS